MPTFIKVATKVVHLKYWKTPCSLEKMLMFMSCCGTYVKVPYDNEEKSPRDQRKQRACAVWFFITLATTWLNVLRLAPSFWTHPSSSLDEALFLKTVIIFWYLQCALNMLVSGYACFNTNCLPRMMHMWTKYFQRGFTKSPMISTLTKLIICLYCGFVACNIILISYIMFSTDETMSNFTAVLYTPVGESVPLQIALLLFQIYFAGAWILPMALYGAVCLINTMFIDETIQEIEKHIDPKSRQFSGDIEDLRLTFENICKMVDVADDTFAFFIVLCLSTDIPLVCMIVYMTIWPETLSAYIMIFNIFMLMITVFHMTIVMWPATRLNSQAHGAVGKLYNIDTRSLTEDAKYELMLFISRLQGPPIGVTAWKLFTIDRTSFLTILSVLLTYFVVLIQMRVPPSAHPASSFSANLTS